MRQRTTFFLRPESPLDPALLTVTPERVTGPAIDAQREDRLTLGLEELPLALARVLTGDVKEFYVRWVAPTGAGEVVSPLLSRLSPGLHVFYTLSAGSTDKKAYVRKAPIADITVTAETDSIVMSCALHCGSCLATTSTASQQR